MADTSPFIWQPTREFIETTNVYRFMQKLGFDAYQDFIRYSQEHLEEFWDKMMSELGIEWFEPYQQTLDVSRGVEWARWFLPGKLNIAWNCLDRHANGSARDRLAVIWEGEDGGIAHLTFLRTAAAKPTGWPTRCATSASRRATVSRSYMPMVPEVVMILYACFKLGLIAVPIFSGFGYDAAAVRLQDSGAKVLFTADFLERSGRLIPLKQKADEALAQRRPRNGADSGLALQERRHPVDRRPRHLVARSRRRASRINAPPCRSIPKHPACCSTLRAPRAAPKAPSTPMLARWCKPPRKSI